MKTVKRKIVSNSHSGIKSRKKCSRLKRTQIIKYKMNVVRNRIKNSGKRLTMEKDAQNYDLI